MKETEKRFWKNGYSKREWGYQLAIGLFGYGLVLYVGNTGWYQFNFYKLIY
jgi:hypothetical protein